MLYALLISYPLRSYYESDIELLCDKTESSNTTFKQQNIGQLLVKIDLPINMKTNITNEQI